MTVPSMDNLRQVDPVNYVRLDDGNVYSYDYSFGDVYLDDIPEDIQTGVDGSEFFYEDGELCYQYGDRAVVVIKEDGAYCSKDVYEKQGRQQAYYALSILGSMGFVGRFHKL